MECTLIIENTLIKVAGSHAKLAGILAGFAFSAIIFLLKHGSTSGDANKDINGTLSMLATSMFGLITASLLYGIVTGAENKSTSIGIQFYLASSVFAFSGVQIFFSMAWLFRWHFSKARTIPVPNLLARFAIFISALFILSDTLDLGKSPFVLPCVLGALLLFILSCIPQLKRRFLHEDKIEVYIVWLCYASMVFVLFAVIFFVGFAYEKIPLDKLWIYNIFFFFQATVFCVFSALLPDFSAGQGPNGN